MISLENPIGNSLDCYTGWSHTTLISAYTKVSKSYVEKHPYDRLVKLTVGQWTGN